MPTREAPPLGMQNFSINKPLFVSPAPAGRKITAGFSFLQRIGKSASIDVWFPEILKQKLDKWIAEGHKLRPENFPAEWAAVRQFELLQEAGNYKIYDMDTTYITRTLMDLTRNMRAGGYRVTVATIGSYVNKTDKDDLEILDRRLQKRISELIHMLYLEEQSDAMNQTFHEALNQGKWDYQTALPHVGVTLGARDLFRPIKDMQKLSKAEQKHKFAQQFFDILNLLPQSHIVHDAAIGLQLPELIGENEWIYMAPGDETLQAFNGLLTDLFAPFNGLSMAALDGHENARSEIKGTVQHMRGYGDRLTAESDQFYRSLARLTLQ